MTAISVVGVMIAILTIFIFPKGNVLTNIISSSSSPPPSANTAIITASVSSEEKHIVPLDQIVSGGPPPDGIPSIDNPKFIPVQEADKFLQDSDLVLGLSIKGDIRSTLFKY